MLYNLFALFGLCMVGRMSPGPDMMLLVRHGAGGPTRAAYACVLGICLGLTFHVTWAVLGTGLLQGSPRAFQAVQLAGAGYLAWVGWKALRARADEEGEDAAPPTLREGFRDGLFCNLLNPKVTLFILSVFTQFVAPGTPTGERVAYGAVIVLEALVGWTIFVRFLDTAPMRRFYERHGLHLVRLTGALLLLLAGWSVVSFLRG